MKKIQHVQKKKGALRRRRARKAKYARENQRYWDRQRDLQGHAPPRYDDIFFEGVAWLNGL
jgi:hypothetical protein